MLVEDAASTGFFYSHFKSVKTGKKSVKRIEGIYKKCLPFGEGYYLKKKAATPYSIFKKMPHCMGRLLKIKERCANAAYSIIKQKQNHIQKKPYPKKNEKISFQFFIPK